MDSHYGADAPRLACLTISVDGVLYKVGPHKSRYVQPSVLSQNHMVFLIKHLHASLALRPQQPDGVYV